MTKRLLFLPNQAVNVSYLLFTLELWALESHDLSQAEKKITVVQAEQSHKMTTIFTQSDNFCQFKQSENYCNFVNLLWFENSSLFEIIHVIQKPTANCLNRCRPSKCFLLNLGVRLSGRVNKHLLGWMIAHAFSRIQEEYTIDRGVGTEEGPRPPT